MGFAIPGALAARIAHPTRSVVAFTGDGGFLMAVAELQTAVREKLPIIILVFDDGEIGRQLLLQPLEPFVERAAPRLTDHISQKKYPDHFEPPIQPRLSPMSLMEKAVLRRSFIRGIRGQISPSHH